MKHRKRSTVIGAALLIFGILLGILTGAALGRMALQWQQTGKPPLLLRPQGGLSKPSAVPTVPVLGPAAPQFTAADAALAPMRYGSDCPYRPNVAKLLQRALAGLPQKAPVVLILHTHGSESYTRQPGQQYEETTEFRSLNTDYNMIALGERLASLLEAKGIRVIHDRTIHDYPSYNSAYSNARDTIRRWLEQEPQICMVLDLHRDALLNSDGSQYAAVATVQGKKAAQIMMVVGTDAAGIRHPGWQENLSAALKLQVLLERLAPGITRPTILRAQRFNQDLSPAALIVEIGTAGNTLQQALESIPYLADGVAALVLGVTADSTS